MDEKLKFNVIPNMGSNSVTLSLLLISKDVGDKWPKSQVLMTKKVVVSNWLFLSGTFPQRLNSAKDTMIRKFKERRRIFVLIDKIINVVHREEYIVKDSKTTELLKKFGVEEKKT